MNVKTTIAHINSITNIVEVKDIMDTEVGAEFPRKMVINACKMRMGELYALDFDALEADVEAFAKNDRTVLSEDEDTEEIVREEVKKNPEPNGDGNIANLALFFEYLNLVPPTSIMEHGALPVVFDLRDIHSDDGKLLWSSLSIKGEIYKLKRQECYDFMQNVSKAAMSKGAQVSFHRPPRAQGFLKIVWKKNS